jgi:hypothetical protein
MTVNVVQVLDLFLDEATLEDETRPPPPRTRRVTLAVQPPHGVVLPASPQRRQRRRRVSFFDVAPDSPVSPSWLRDQLEDNDIGNPLGGRSANWTGREWAATAMEDEHQVRRYFPGLSMMEEAESDGRFGRKIFCAKIYIFLFAGVEHFGTLNIQTKMATFVFRYNASLLANRRLAEQSYCNFYLSSRFSEKFYRNV